MQGIDSGFSQVAQKGGGDGSGPSIVWNFPVDITFKATNPFGWPRLVISVFSQVRGRVCGAPRRPRRRSTPTVTPLPADRTFLAGTSSAAMARCSCRRCQARTCATCAPLRQRPPRSCRRVLHGSRATSPNFMTRVLLRQGRAVRSCARHLWASCASRCQLSRAAWLRTGSCREGRQTRSPTRAVMAMREERVGVRVGVLYRAQSVRQSGRGGGWAHARLQVCLSSHHSTPLSRFQWEALALVARGARCSSLAP